MTQVLSTYLGGSEVDSIRDVALDVDGNIYVTGGTKSADFPTTQGAYDRTLNQGPFPLYNWDVFVAKLAPGGQILWSTFLGGPYYDRAYAIEVDAQGFVYVAGRAGAGFPVTPGAFDITFGGGTWGSIYSPQDGFVCKLTPTGSALVFCSYLGTNDDQILRDVAVDGTGDIYVTGAKNTGSAPLPADWFAGAFQQTPRGASDALVAKIRSDGSQVLWATYLGGSDIESHQNTVRLDAQAHSYVLLNTWSTDMPTTDGAFQRQSGGLTDLFLAKLEVDGSRLLFGTYLGGSAEELVETHQLAVDAQGHAYVASGTLSSDFPTTPGSFQLTYGGTGGADTGNPGNFPGDAFVAKFSHDGRELLRSTFLGGRYGEGVEGIAVDADSNVYVSGVTFSDNFPVTPGAFQSTYRRGRDGFTVVVAADLGNLLYGSYMGGSNQDFLRCAALDPAGSFLVAGYSDSPDWPTINPIQGYGGGLDGVIVKFAPWNVAP